MRRMHDKFLLLLTVSALMLSSCYKQFDPESYQPDLNIGGYTSSWEIAPENLIAYWGFNGNLNDSISGTTATNVGMTTTGGIKGQAIQGAVDAYLLATPSEEIVNMESFTISYWINSPLNDAGIVGTVGLSNSARFWGNIMPFFENGGSETVAKFKYILTSNSTEVSSDVYDLQNFWGKWNNMTITYDAATSTGTIYVNGSRVGSKEHTGLGALSFQNAESLVFGTVQFQTTPSLTSEAEKQDWAGFLTGAMDEIRIYNKALTAAEISSMVKLEGRGK